MLTPPRSQVLSLFTCILHDRVSNTVNILISTSSLLTYVLPFMKRLYHIFIHDMLTDHSWNPIWSYEWFPLLLRYRCWSRFVVSLHSEGNSIYFLSHSHWRLLWARKGIHPSVKMSSTRVKNTLSITPHCIICMHSLLRFINSITFPHFLL